MCIARCRAQPQDGGRRLRRCGPRAHLRGLTPRKVPMNHSNKDGASSTFSHSTRTRLRAGLRVSHGWASVRTIDKIGRRLSEGRSGCASNKHPSGSVRGHRATGVPTAISLRIRRPSRGARGPWAEPGVDFVDCQNAHRAGSLGPN